MKVFGLLDKETIKYDLLVCKNLGRFGVVWLLLVISLSLIIIFQKDYNMMLFYVSAASLIGLAVIYVRDMISNIRLKESVADLKTKLKTLKKDAENRRDRRGKNGNIDKDKTLVH